MNEITWTYDDDGRLIEEVFDHYDDLLDQTQYFTYDLTGNRLEKRIDQGNTGAIDQVFTSLYDANDRLLTEEADLDNNGTADRITDYTYTGTQQTGKEVAESGVLQSQTTFGYDLQGRMDEVAIKSYDNGTLAREERTTYVYDATGIRVSALHEVDENANGTFDTATRTEYLNDPHNHTGYSRVLQETEIDVATEEILKRTVYVIGHSTISQTTIEYEGGQPESEETLFFAPDGHGSTRVLLNAVGAIATVAGVEQVFHFDAYGNALGFDPALAATSVLYAGEMFDARIQQQYLRARWYDAQTGRFNRLDPFFGNLDDPLSLHKYLYTHADPVNGVDPAGLNVFFAHMGRAIHVQLSELYWLRHLGNVVSFGSGLPGIGGAILPDIVDFSLGQIGDFKPLSPYGRTSGPIQVQAALALANGQSTTYGGNLIESSVAIPHTGPQQTWIPMTWDIKGTVVWPGAVDPYYRQWIAVVVGTAGGVLYYHRMRLPTGLEFNWALAHVLETQLAPLVERLAKELWQGSRHGLDFATQLIYQHQLEAVLAAGIGTFAGVAGRATVSKIETARMQFMSSWSGGFGALGGAFA